MSCALCHQRKPKRSCPGVHGQICSLCCGTERENTVDCPLDCVYLEEAHLYEWERTPSAPLAEIPHAQYEITDEFLHQHEPFVAQLARRMLERSLELPGTRDSDLLAALDSLIRTRETLASGLYYESLPDTPVPQALFRDLQESILESSKDIQKEEKRGLKDEDVLKCLVFLARLGRARGSHRPRSKAYLGFLRRQFPEVAAQKTPSGLILPG